MEVEDGRADHFKVFVEAVSLGVAVNRRRSLDKDFQAADLDRLEAAVSVDDILAAVRSARCVEVSSSFRW